MEKILFYWLKSGLLLLVIGIVSDLIQFIFTKDSFVRGVGELQVWLILGNKNTLSSLDVLFIILGIIELFIIGCVIGLIYRKIK